jgi:hypothetical protein
MAPKKTAAKAAPKRSMSDEHKAAIKEGRVQNKAVSDYLEALESTKGKRGRQRTPESIQKRLSAIDEALQSASAATRLNLLQEQEDLTAELAAKQVTVDLGAVEAAFVEHAAAYGARKGISYAVWRKSGVAPAVLKKAGIGRGT